VEEALTRGKTEIAEKEIQKLKSQIADLPQNSVVILDATHELQRLDDANFWNNLTPDKFEF